MRTSMFLTVLATLAAPALAHPATQASPAATWTTASSATFKEVQGAANLTARQFVFDMGPGAPNPPHVHGGDKMVLVLSGELTVAPNGVKHVLKAGETYLMRAGEICTLANDSVQNTRFVMTVLLPDGAAMTTPLSGKRKANVE